jgi:signal transduction histidine kinase
MINFKKYIHLLPPNITLAIDIFLALFFAFGIYVYSEKQIDIANERRIVSYQLADQLRQSSNDLTRITRTYVVTLDPRHKQIYQEILDIRNGTQARPEGYSLSYWDLVLANQISPTASGRTVALLDLMRENGFTEEELKTLSEAKANSDTLAKLELEAMKLAESGTEANRRKAALMLHDENYHLAKAHIMAPINAFHQQMEERTQTAVRNAKYTALIFMVIFSTGLFAASILLWRAYIHLRHSLGGSAEEVRSHIASIGQGDLSTPMPETAATKDSVRAGLFEMQNQLLMHQTERNLAAAVLKQSQADLEEAQRMAHIGSWQMDPAFNHVIWSNELYRIFALDSALPAPSYEGHKKLFSEKSWDQLNFAMSGIVDSGTPFEIELEMIRVDGTQGWLLSRGEAIRDAQNNVISLHGIAADITERKQTEAATNALRDQLLQATKMEAVGHLTAGIAHDFNNMLGAMMGYTEITKQVVASGQVQNVDRYLGEILNAGQRAKELIAQMLTFSRTQTDTSNMEVPITLVTPVIKEVVAMLRSSIPSSIDLNYQSSDPDLKVHIQPVNLHQIILNLTVNARDAMGEYGRIDIKISKQTVSDQLCASCKQAFSGSFIKISVTDTGSGIDGHLLQNIFNPFFTTKEVGKGTGMGLSVVHGLVHKLGGHIEVESTLKKGSKFSIWLPEAVSEQVTVNLNDILEVTGGTLAGIRIMIVDDEISMSTVLKEFLTMQGALTSVFNSPVAAFDAFEEHPDQVDIVITDETMPGLTGMHLAELMLKQRPELPIILCTGYSEHATPALAEKAGLAGFFRKPLKLNDILRKIRLVLHTKNRIS